MIFARGTMMVNAYHCTSQLTYININITSYNALQYTLCEQNKFSIFRQIVITVSPTYSLIFKECRQSYTTHSHVLKHPENLCSRGTCYKDTKA